MAYERIERRLTLKSGAGEIVATIHLPQNTNFPERHPVFFMFPGAGYGRGYFDITYPGFTGYSEAEYHVSRGYIVVAVDHLGVGDSKANNPGTLSSEDIAAASAECVRDVLGALGKGTLAPHVPPVRSPVVIGAGQSMGGFFIVYMQAHHQLFDGIVLLGTSVTQTRLTLLPGRRYPKRQASAAEVLKAAQTDSDVRAAFHWPEEPKELVEADMSTTPYAPWRSATMPVATGTFLEPAIIAWECATVRVPVLLVYGEIDVTADPLADVAVFRNTSDIALFIVEDMAHMHNFAPTRRRVWDRLERFALQVAAA